MKNMQNFNTKHSFRGHEINRLISLRDEDPLRRCSCRHYGAVLVACDTGVILEKNIALKHPVVRIGIA